MQSTSFCYYLTFHGKERCGDKKNESGMACNKRFPVKTLLRILSTHKLMSCVVWAETQWSPFVFINVVVDTFAMWCWDFLSHSVITNGNCGTNMRKYNIFEKTLCWIIYLFKLAVGVSKRRFGTCQEMFFHKYKLQK